ncbi:MAG: hypothetical protein HYV39_02995 [Candidatus Levybacteria bacterium]|nr:hypothetical protein [Candidatus Levybacteria bacterium]
MATIPYRETIIEYFNKLNVSYQISSTAKVDVDFPAAFVGAIIAQKGTVIWLENEHAWAVQFGSEPAKLLTQPKAQSAPVPAKAKAVAAAVVKPVRKVSKKSSFGIPQFGLLAAVLFFALSGGKLNLPGASTPDDPNAYQSMATASATPELVGDPDAFCSQELGKTVTGVKVFEVTESGLTGTTKDLYPQAEMATYFYAKEVERGMPFLTVSWLFQSADANAEFEKAIALDTAKMDPNVDCVDQSCSKLWTSSINLANDYRIETFYNENRDLTDPLYYKNVPAEMFTAFREWIVEVVAAGKNGTSYPRCIEIPAVKDMAEVSKEAKDWLLNNQPQRGNAQLPSSGSKGPRPTDQPLIITATPTLGYVGSNAPAFDKYAAVVGATDAQTAFTADPDQQCYVNLTVNWPDFTMTSSLNEVIRILGPSSWTFRSIGDGTFQARSYETDANGYAACAKVLNLETEYSAGTWRIGNTGVVATLHWENYGLPDEIKVGSAFIFPVYSDQVVAESESYDIIPTSTPSVSSASIYDLYDVMISKGWTELVSTGCPFEPINGSVTTSSAFTVDFGYNDVLAGQKYSKDGCDLFGGLHFTTYDPGQGDSQVLYGGKLYVYPYTKVQYQPSPTPGGPTYPPDGSQISLADLLKYETGYGEKANSVGCKNGSIPGWPNHVPVKTNVYNYLVDFSAIAGQTNGLCVYDPVKMTTSSVLYWSIYEYQGYGSIIQYGGYWFAPFK